MSVTEMPRRPLLSTKELFGSDREFAEKIDRAVKKLYGGNVNEFNQFMAKIEPLEDWKVVLDIIDAEFAKKKIKPDSKEATGLTDVLFKRYFPSY